MAIGVKKYYTEEMKADIDFNTGILAEVLEESEAHDNHFHTFERWFETAASADGEVHVADRIGSGGGAFQLDAGNDDWSDWLQILGSSDTPISANHNSFDIHEIQITAAERTLLYYIQFAAGSSPAQALINGKHTEIPFLPQSVQAKEDYVSIKIKRLNVGTKIWARCKCPGQNTATLDFIHGIHEYILDEELK